MIHRVPVPTEDHDQFIDITSKIQEVVSQSGVTEGICVVYVPHTTAAVTIQENDDPNVAVDIVDALDRLFPDKGKQAYKHFEENAPSHLKASLIGTSDTVFLEDGRLQLGRWQSIFLCEFDGPRQREVWVRVTQ